MAGRFSRLFLDYEEAEVVTFQKDNRYVFKNLEKSSFLLADVFYRSIMAENIPHLVKIEITDLRNSVNP